MHDKLLPGDRNYLRWVILAGQSNILNGMKEVLHTTRQEAARKCIYTCFSVLQGRSKVIRLRKYYCNKKYNVRMSEARMIRFSMMFDMNGGDTFKEDLNEDNRMKIFLEFWLQNDVNVGTTDVQTVLGEHAEE